MTDQSPPRDAGPDDLRPEAVERELAEPKRLWLADLSIRQPVFITMFVLAVMVVGAISYLRMGLDLFPDISFPVAVVQTAYPGASPQEVERSVTKPIEDALVSINGVETLTSTSQDSLSMVLVQFDMNKNDREAVDDVRTRMNMVRNALPSDVREPLILRFDPSSAPIIAFAIADQSGKLTPEELRSLLDDKLKPRLEQVDGVAAVNATGGIVKEVHIDIQASQLEAQGISPQQITQAIRSESLDVPAGRIVDGGREAPLRTAGQVTSLAQLEDIPVVTKQGGVVVRIKDIAAVSEGQAEVRTLSRLDGRDSVVAQIQKQSGSNTVQVADGIKRELARFQKDYPDLSFGIAFDQSDFTRQSVDDTQLSLIIGAVLAALVVFLFFRDLRNTLVTVAGLPMVILGTFMVLYIIGISINTISLMALALSIGMLIDDAIVVRENIFRHMERGETPKVAASRGTGEIGLAVLAVSSTIVAVFLPIAFAEGIVGKFMRDFGATVAVAVIISLVEAFTLAPMLSAYFFKRIEPVQNGQSSLIERIFQGLNWKYRGMLSWSLRHRLLVVIASILVFASSLAIIPFMVFSFISEQDQGQFAIGVELPPGSQLADTNRTARALEAVVRNAPGVANVFTTVGSNDGSVEAASVNVKLVRQGLTNSLIEQLRPDMELAANGAKLSINRQSASTAISGGSAAAAFGGAPIQYAVQGEDFKELDEVSAALVAAIRQVPGAVDVDRSLKPGKPGQTIVLNRAMASDLGVSSAQVGTTVRALVNGERAGTYRSGEKDLNIVVRMAGADRANPANILRLPLVTARGTQVTLSSVASIVQSSEPAQISRENRQRQVLISANYLGRSVGEVTADIQAVVASQPLPPGVSVHATGQTKYQEQMAGAFGTAMLLAVLFVYMILASQFGSFIHPFTIMLALPFSIIGALIGLFAFRFSFDMLAMIGIILLMGLVTKNSILLVDFINQLRRRGLAARDAILEAGPIRLRPILMTTLAMVFGMVPAAVGFGAGAESRQPMAIAVIGGLLSSTILTLVVVPVVYSLIDDLTRLILRRPG